MSTPEKKDPARVKSGRKGGQANRDRHLAEDPDYFSKLGRRGGTKGGAVTRDRYGSEHFSEIASRPRRQQPGAQPGARPEETAP